MAGKAFQYTKFRYSRPLLNQEQVPETYNFTKLFSLWKSKASELNLNRMRYIHGKDWDAKLLEALIAERIKPNKAAAIPEIHIGVNQDTQVSNT